MNDIIFYLVAGLGIGSLYAMLGAGLVVVYKGSGVINFAQGAMAMYGVFTFDEAWNQRRDLPAVGRLPARPSRSTCRSRSRSATAARSPMGVAFADRPGDGGADRPAAHFLVFRPLRNAAPLGKVVASLGVVLYLQGVALLNFGTSYPTPKSVFPDERPVRQLPRARQPVPPQQPLRLLRRRHPRRRRVGGLQVHPLRHGHPGRGRATRRAPCCSATRRSAWPPRTGSPPSCSPRSRRSSSARSRARSRRSGSTALIVAALAAALIGGLKSIPVTMAGGLGLGMAQLAAARAQRRLVRLDAASSAGIVAALPLVVIVVVLFLRGKSLPIRGTVEEQRLPLSPYPVRVPQHAVVWVTVVDRSPPSCSRTAASAPCSPVPCRRRWSFVDHHALDGRADRLRRARSRWPRCRWPASPPSSWPG